MSSFPRVTAVWLVATGLLVLTGCGSVPVKIRGKVTLNGTPVEAGTITFIPEDQTKGRSGGASIAQGAYQVDAGNPPPPGMYRIEITAPKKTGNKIPAGSPAPPGTMIDEMTEAVPTKYNTKSELKRELKAGDNVFDFDLTSGK